MRIGLASTDQLYFASGFLDCPGAMFTASHNPAAYNGIKLCRAGAKPVGDDTGLSIIRDELIAGVPAYDGPRGQVHDQDVLADYGEFLRSLVDLTELRALRVAVDAGNGMAGHTAPAVLGPISALTVLPLYFELDGSFPNHEANPLEPANLVDLQKFVIDTGADIGLAFDGDADRCFVVDELGKPISPSAVTALVAARELKREIGATVIHNLITSRAVPELVIERGGTPVRSRVGHSYIKGLMADTGAIFGGEHSAHYYFRDFWGADSGMLAALHVLAALGEQDRPLSDFMADYQRYEASGEINFRVADAPTCVEAVLKNFGNRSCFTRPSRRGHRRPRRRRLVQPADLQHRAVAAAQRRGPHRRGDRRHRRPDSRRDSHAARGRHMSSPHATVDLDDIEGLLEADRDGLLRAAAMAGAQVRATAAAVEEGALESVRRPAAPHADLGRRPRSGREPQAPCSPASFSGVAGEPIVVAAQSPPWIGPLDVLVVAGDDPGDPALVGAAATAVRRGARRRRRRPVRRPAARRDRGQDRGPGPAAVGARRVRAVPLSRRRSGHLAGHRPRVEQLTSPPWPTNSTPRRCATASAVRCSPTRPKRWPSGWPTVRWCSPATAWPPWRSARHGAAVLLRVAHRPVAAAGLADAIVALRGGMAKRFREPGRRVVPRRGDRRTAVQPARGCSRWPWTPSGRWSSARVAGLDDVDVVGAEDVGEAGSVPVQAGRIEQQLATLAVRLEMAAVYLRLLGG